MPDDRSYRGGDASTYFRKSEPDARIREGYWRAAFGLQRVDGLRPSIYARTLAEQNVAGELTLTEVAAALRDYHSTSHPELPPRTPEADIVSQRIVRLLEDGWFDLTPHILTYIHESLFKGLDDPVYQPGRYKDDLYYKCEPVLNGDSVMYAAPGSIDASLVSAFRREAAWRYDLGPGRSYLSWADATNLADFISRVWRAHPFMEGNTRTVAVFAELYLSELGMRVDNTLFEAESIYFRDALVRASYANLRVGVARTCEPLVGFLTKLIEEPMAELDYDALWCVQLFEHPEAVRTVPLADARPMQEQLLDSGVSARVLARASAWAQSPDAGVRRPG